MNGEGASRTNSKWTRAGRYREELLISSMCLLEVGPKRRQVSAISSTQVAVKRFSLAFLSCQP